MKDLIQQHLQNNGINEPFNAIFLRYTEKMWKDENGNYHVEYPKWRFSCPKPQFTSQQIEDSLKAEYITAHTQGIEYKYSNDEATKQSKLDELNALTDLELIKNFSY